MPIAGLAVAAANAETERIETVAGIYLSHR
jgi:hypothetical protein